MSVIDIIIIPVVAIFILILVSWFALELFFYLAYVRSYQRKWITKDDE